MLSRRQLLVTRSWACCRFAELPQLLNCLLVLRSDGFWFLTCSIARRKVSALCNAHEKVVYRWYRSGGRAPGERRGH